MHLISYELLPLFIGVAGYLIYFKILKCARIETLLNQYFKTSKQSFYWVQFTRGVAFICMALLLLAFLKTSNLEFWELTYTWTPTDSKYTIILALILMPSDPVLNDHYGDALWMQDKKVQARYYWKYASSSEEADIKLKKSAKEKSILGLN